MDVDMQPRYLLIRSIQKQAQEWEFLDIFWNPKKSHYTVVQILSYHTYSTPEPVCSVGIII